MTEIILRCRFNIRLSAIRSFAVLICLIVWLGVVNAQQATSATDGLTPSGMTPGAPAGSYMLSGFENVNPYNGHLNFHLPLLKIHGRGDVQMTMMLDIEQVWGVGHLAMDPPAPPSLDYPTYNAWDSILPGYGPPVVQVRNIAAACGPNQTVTGSTARITVTDSDGTEHEFRDVLNDGKPSTNTPCTGSSPTAGLRGSVFASTDGTAGSFIFDTPWLDSSTSGAITTPTGYLLLPDGTRYRVVDGNVQWMADRNGNMLQFTYDVLDQRVTSITDSLQRQVTVSYDVQDVAPFGLSDKITFMGVGGAQRIIHVSKGPLHAALRSDFSIQTYASLFPELNGSASLGGPGGSNHDPTVVTTVWLPDGRRYQFLYNSYSELARVILPTGGAIEYDYAAGAGTPTSGVIGGSPENAIYRRVVERRVYSDGSTMEGKTQFSSPESFNPPQPYVNVDHRDPAGAFLAREQHNFYGSPIASILNALINNNWFSEWNEGREFQTDALATNGTTVLRREVNTWQQRDVVSWWPGPGLPPSKDPRIIETDTTLMDVTLVSKQTFNYDQYNNKIFTREFDYGAGTPGPLVRCSSTTYLTSGYDTVNPSPTSPDPNQTSHLRSLPTNQAVYAGDCVGTPVAQTQFEYDNYTEGLTASNAVEHDPSFSATYTRRGNVTAVEHWRNTDGAFLTTRNQFDDAGNLRKSVDPKGNATILSHADAWGNTACQPVGGSAAAYLTSATNALGHVTSSAYDSCTGRAMSATDANGQTTTFAYNDPLDRPTNATRPAGGGSTNLTYDDANHIITTASDLNTLGDGSLKGATVYDGLGRTIETRQYETPSAYITTKQTYDAMGRKKTVSNPYRSTTDPTYGITTLGYDSLSRVTSTTMPDGAVMATPYIGNTTTVTDPAGKSRKSTSDALGRLTQVIEDPLGSAYPTNYTYDALDDLKTVQQGVQTRTFVYNSLKQFTSAANPESGTVNYTYDANGNLASKTDARGITTTYAYDALNRMTNRSYSDTITPAVTYNYDASGVANSKGRLTSVSSSVSSNSYGAYDPMGRALSYSQTTNGQVYAIGYTYNLAGGILHETYPSGRVVMTGYDSAGRVNAVTGTSGTLNTAYVTAVSYAPQGASTSMSLGNGLMESTAFNNRLQPTSIGLGALVSFGYGYGTTNNNGNVLSQTISAPGWGVTQSYGYDPLNRLTSASESASWSQSYGYDQYGNRTSVTSPTYLPTYAPAPAVNATNNRISDASFGYDAVGNLTRGPIVPAGALQNYGYDAENHLISFNTGAATYSYDGDGKRVKKTVGSATTIFVYDVGGRLIAEYSNTASTTGGGTLYLTADHLGSTRGVTDGSGNLKARHDYLPFGEEVPSGIGGRTTALGYAGNDGVRQKFTGKESDSETGLDNFFARYYSGVQGRFPSSDEPFADQNFSYPQSWNLYIYGRNNPLRFTDLEGRKCVTVTVGGQEQQADDGAGGGCEVAGVSANGTIKPQQVNVQDFEPPSPLLLAVAQGAQRAGPTVNALGIATGVIVTGGAVMAAVGAIGGGTGLISLSIGATRAATLTPLLLPAGQKLAQIIARLGEGQQNPQLVLQKLNEFRDAAVAGGTYVQGFYIQNGVTIYRVGQNYLTVSGQGKILSYVQGATRAIGVAQRYLELGGK